MACLIGRAPTTASASGPASSAEIFDRLDDEWWRVSRSSASMWVARELAAANPALAGCTNLADVVSLVRWEGLYPTEAAKRVLEALLRQASCPLVARALLQALLPRIRREKVTLPMYGHGLSEHCQDPCDTMSDLVAECYAAICRHSGEEHHHVARLVVQEAVRRVRTARQGQRRYQQRTQPLTEVLEAQAACAPSSGWGLEVDLWRARTSAEWLASAVVDALRSGHMTLEEARLLCAVRVWGFRASEAGRRERLPKKAVYYALSRAEQALVRKMA
ncbi:MAG: hypothetical protein ACP5VR_06080 [Acidimicrobiales bacterium]